MRNVHDFSKDAMEALAKKSPRLAGLVMFLLGLAILGGNIAYAYCSGIFSPTLLVGSFVLGPLGLWVSLTGRTHNSKGPAPLWWHAGTFLLGGVGFAVGLYLAIRLRTPQ